MIKSFIIGFVFMIFLLSILKAGEQEAKEGFIEILSKEKKINLLLVTFENEKYLNVTGGGNYKLKKILSSKEGQLYLIIERKGAPIDEKGRYDFSKKGLIGKYVLSFSEEEMHNKLILLGDLTKKAGP
jgi:hypothetical protein